MKSPCHDCHMIHLAGIDKRNDTCLNCKDRLEYVASLGSMTHSVPDKMCDYLATPKPLEKPMHEIAKPDETMRICPDCEKPLPATTDYFNKSAKSKDGLMKLCIACHGERIKAGHKRKAKQKAHPKQPLKKKSGFVPGIKTSDDSVIYLNFKEHTELLAALNKAADDQFRSLDNQILWILKSSMEAHTASKELIATASTI